LQMEIEAVIILVFLVFYLIWAVIRALYRLLTGAAPREKEERQGWLDELRKHEQERERQAELRRKIVEDAENQFSDNVHGSEPTGPVTQGEAYELLGVSPGCKQQELAAAYRRRILQWHPDKLETMAQELRDFATRRTARINEAYARLQRRAAQAS
jgi:DnaJ-domain-containing protein 1